MYSFQFRLKPQDVVGTVERPAFRYGFRGEAIPGFHHEDYTVDYFVFEAIVDSEQAILDVWPQAFNIEDKTNERFQQGVGDVVWVDPPKEEETGMYRVRFYVCGEDTRPIKAPPPHPVWNTGGGFGYDVWVGYFDSMEQLREYWPDAFYLDVFESGLTEYRFSDRMSAPEWLGQEPGTQGPTAPPEKE